MAGLNDLVNNITGSVSNLVDQILGKTNDSAIPAYYQGVSSYSLVQATVNKASWNKLVFPYTFSVVNILKGDDSGGFGDFSLPLAPGSINQKETPATNITPTQGGTSVNKGGVGYFDLVISGTTGIAPFRGDGGVQASSGTAIFQPNELKYRSGYEVFLHLRNWFRSYEMWKYKQGKQAQDHRLIFKNYKDGEFLIVELVDFEMDRQAARSFLYDYKITFKVLGHFQFQAPQSATGFLADVDSLVSNALDKINTARGALLRTQGILRQVESTYESTVLAPLTAASLAIKALQGIPLVAADVSSQAIKNTMTDANTLAVLLGIQQQQSANAVGGGLDPRIEAISLPNDLKAASTNQGASIISSFGEGLMALNPSIFPPKTLDAAAIEQQNATQLPRSYYNEAIAGLVRVKQNAEDFFNLGSAAYDTLFDRTATLTGTSTVTSDQYDILNAFNEATTGLYLLLSTTDLFKSTFDDKIQDMVARFNGNITLDSSPAVKQYQIPSETTLERISQQQLGDSTRWGEIVELNNLKWPYISDDPMESRDGVKKIGDMLLIPAPILNGFSQVPDVVTNKLTSSMTELERSLGCDLKIDSNFDLVLTSSGDLDIVAGVDNMAQAVIIKLAYEPGDVILYPSLGAGLVPGRKMPTIKDIQDGVTNSLLQDSRVDTISNLSIVRQSDMLFLQFELFVKNVDLPIPISIQL